MSDEAQKNTAHPPLWQAILDRLSQFDPPPASTSLDAVREALDDVVGRTTLQRIRDGYSHTQMKSLSAIADKLEMDIALVVRLSRGEPVVEAPKRPRVSMAEALAALGDSLAADMPIEVRQDVADLLHKLAMRRGEPRHQGELATLLGAISGPALMPNSTQNTVDLNQTNPAKAPHHPPQTPTSRGDTRGAEWEEMRKHTSKPARGAREEIQSNVHRLKPTPGKEDQE